MSRSRWPPVSPRSTVRGAGKSLILEAIAGLCRPDSGRILLDDVILFDGQSGVDAPPRRRNCGFVAQRDALFPHMTLRQNLVFPPGVFRVSNAIAAWGK